MSLPKLADARLDVGKSLGIQPAKLHASRAASGLPKLSRTHANLRSADTAEVDALQSRCGRATLRLAELPDPTLDALHAAEV